jgi:uncharacterized protein (UPF0335 family)
MTETQELRGWESGARWQGVDSEHQALDRIVDRVEAMLGRLARGQKGEEAKVRGLVGELRARFFEHLDGEEANRILEQAATVAPRFAGRVDRLLGEHDDLRARMRALVAGADGEGWTGLHARFVEFRRVLRAHERAENDVVQRAYLEDLGGMG